MRREVEKRTGFLLREDGVHSARIEPAVDDAKLCLRNPKPPIGLVGIGGVDSQTQEPGVGHEAPEYRLKRGELIAPRAVVIHEHPLAALQRTHHDDRVSHVDEVRIGKCRVIREVHRVVDVLERDVLGEARHGRDSQRRINRVVVEHLALEARAEIGWRGNRDDRVVPAPAERSSCVEDRLCIGFCRRQKVLVAKQDAPRHGGALAHELTARRLSVIMTAGMVSTAAIKQVTSLIAMARPKEFIAIFALT